MYDEETYPQTIEEIKTEDSEDRKIYRKHIFNAGYRENGQRNLIIQEGLDKSRNDDDLILISDVDEVPQLARNKF